LEEVVGQDVVLGEAEVVEKENEIER